MALLALGHSKGQKGSSPISSGVVCCEDPWLVLEKGRWPITLSSTDLCWSCAPSSQLAHAEHALSVDSVVLLHSTMHAHSSQGGVAQHEQAW
jgi:hypothetical protein